VPSSRSARPHGCARLRGREPESWRSATAEAGVDLIVAQGYEAGGHTGQIATMVLLPEVVDAVGGAPVMGAGGIGAGARSLGAAGVWCGSPLRRRRPIPWSRRSSSPPRPPTRSARGRARASRPASCARPGPTSGLARRRRCHWACRATGARRRGAPAHRPGGPPQRLGRRTQHRYRAMYRHPQWRCVSPIARGIRTPFAQARLSGDPGGLASLRSTTPGAASRSHKAQDCL
jgi:Nitronate monooxygenase